MDYMKTTYSNRGIFYRQYNGETDLKYIMSLVQNELSEPYVVYTYRYFLQGWPNLSFLAFPEDTGGVPSRSEAPIGVIVCKQSIHKGKTRRGYIAMLSVDKEWRKRGIASTLVKLSIEMMTRTGADEIVLETEVDNAAALGLYSSLGFIREKRLYRFYMNGKDAFRLVLPVIPDEAGDLNVSTAPISVPLIKFPNDPAPIATLETPPSPLYPIHGRGLGLPEADLNSEPDSSFAIGAILGAASPRSVGSDDSFVLYGAHIPSSISPPLPARAMQAKTTTRMPRDDEDWYISGR